MGCDNGTELIAARQRITDLEDLVASLYNKIEILESQNSVLQESLHISEKDREAREALKQSLEEKQKASFNSEDKSEFDGIQEGIACASSVEKTGAHAADIPGKLKDFPQTEGVQTMDADQFLSYAPDIFPTPTMTKPRKEKGDLSHHSRRHVALKIMYLGARFHGFASESSTQRTIESELFAALEKTKLMIGGRLEAKYTRCGRTDKGVSANGQVVALLLRSCHKDPVLVNVIPGEDRVAAALASRFQESQFAKVPDYEEIDYVGVLNRALPPDIRILGWCYVPYNFHARFSCMAREYIYFFVNDGLDIEAMRIAASKFKGEHDFRNFCKMDADNVHNFRREILAFDIVPFMDRWDGFELWMFQVKGTAFLWHQVRCMVAVLLMVGQKHESPSVVDDLLNTQKTARKPQYVMAPESCLVLQSCEFQGLSFFCPPGSARFLYMHWENLIRDHLLAAAMLKQVCKQFPFCDGSERSREATWKKSPHVLLCCRPTEPTYAERRTKLLNKKQGTSLS